MAKSRQKKKLSRSELMARVRQRDTSAERAVRSIVHRLGHRYRTNARDLPGSPDLVNRRQGWAIFVHGCFWHGHQGCKKATVPKTRRDWWRRKLCENRQRDRRKARQLEALGFSVLTIWECEFQESLVAERKLRKFLVKRCPVPNLDGAREDYSFSGSGKSVARTVNVADGIPVTTRLRVEGVSMDGTDAQTAFEAALLRKKSRPLERVQRARVNVVDLFSGCGGLSAGAREACRALGLRFVPHAAVDLDVDCRTVYRRNFSPEFEWADITTVLDGEVGATPSVEERRLVQQLARVDLLLAGPPCQGHSDLNNHSRRNDRRNSLYGRVARFVELVWPQHVLIENVPTVVHDREAHASAAIAAIRDLGYHVDDGVIDLAALGVPQRRRRHVVLGSLTQELKVEDVVAQHCVQSERFVRWAIGDLERESSNGAFTRAARHSEANLRRIRYLQENDVHDLPDALRPPCHQRGGHSYKSMYGRLWYDRPAQTITSGFGSPGQGRFVHPTRPRTVTPHEAARLQFLPDFLSFAAVNRRTKLAQMIGNAVPMKLAYVFCIELLA